MFVYFYGITIRKYRKNNNFFTIYYENLRIKR
nr:MAG TPA: hypothetical protein [Caudoviricetes sp.]